MLSPTTSRFASWRPPKTLSTSLEREEPNASLTFVLDSFAALLRPDRSPRGCPYPMLNSIAGWKQVRLCEAAPRLMDFPRPFLHQSLAILQILAIVPLILAQSPLFALHLVLHLRPCGSG